MTDTPPELTAEEARALAEELGTQLYRAQDALAFVEECCVIAERSGRTITVADVRTWLKGAQCGRQLAVEEPSLYDKITGMFGGPFPPLGDEPPATALPCNHAHLRQPHDPHPWQPQPGMRHVQCPGWAHVPAEDVPHIYLSSSCHPTHGHERLTNGQTGHEYCESMTGLNGAKRPAECKHCGAKCQCPNHAVAS